MRSFIEKLAKLIETEGICISGTAYKILDFEICFIPGNDTTFLIIKNKMTNECAHLKLYDEEKDIISKAIDRCEEKTIDSIIEQLNNL